MNTPAHGIFNLLVLSRRGEANGVVPVAVGAVLPDLPMVVFYAWERLRAVPEGTIWSIDYYHAGWQAVFDSFHSLPLLALGWFVARLRRNRWSAFLLASMMLHAVADLPLHREDAHRHFFPLSDWQFESALSYWHPAYGGQWYMLAELLLVLVGTPLLWRRFPEPAPRIAVVLLAGSYLGYLVFVALVWM
ncbi:MAG: hypothetical protein GEU99_02795 [Luteitalea sp.]|nr:hypothetical protein [Luteitalea sp.]